MDDIYYLIHTTDNPDCVKWTELKTAPFNTNDQFPGVYLSIITKDNIDTENVFLGKYIIILSKKILLQENYHINFRDHNGIISEKNTYFPWNLNDFISKSKQSSSIYGNEVVFHDNIDMKYCCSIIGIFKKQFHIKLNHFLPKISMDNEADPDMTKKPFFCYPFEDIYTGEGSITKSSNKWFTMMSKVCNINQPYNTSKNIIQILKDNSESLFHNRSQQQIEVLKEYTQKMNRTTSIKGGRHTRRRR